MAFLENSNNSSFHDSHFTFVQGNVYNDHNGPTGTSSGMTDLIRRNKDVWPDSVNNFTIMKFGDLELIQRRRCLQLKIQVEDDSPASERPDTNPFRPRIKCRSTTPKVVKVTRTVDTAKIAGRGSDMVTVVRYEAEEGVASHAFAACKLEFEYWSRTRHPKLPQLFGVTHASIPALVYRNARVNANEAFDRYRVSPIISTFLRILQRIDYDDVDTSVPGIFKPGESVPFSSWDFDFSTQSFYYNLDFPVNTHMKAPLKIISEETYVDDWDIWADLKRPQISPPALDNGLAIIDYLSHITGDYLDVIAALGSMSVVDPLEIALDGLIPFGACFQKRWGEKRGPILASFWYTEIITKYSLKTELDVNASWVNSYFRVSFPNRRQGGDFTCWVHIAPPMDQRIHFGRAFLSQSFVFMQKTGVHPGSCYLLDSVRIIIKGRFEPPHSAASADPICLFLGPFEWETLDGMYCLKCPLDGSFAHWSLDPDGPSASVDADSYGLPQLEQEFRVGSWWDLEHYEAVEEYLCFKGYDPYSTAYAEDQGYPFLISRTVGPEVDHQSVFYDEAGSDGRDGFDIASHRSNQRRMKKIGSKIRRFVDSFARRKKHY